MEGPFSMPENPVRRTKQARGRRASPAAHAEVDHLLGDQPLQRERLIEYLHLLQDHHGGLAPDHLVALAERLHLAPVEVQEVASFYHHFELLADPQPSALPRLRVCDSLACRLAGAEGLIERLQATLGQRVRLQRVSCVGRCDCAPVAVLEQHPIAPASSERITDCLSNGRTRAPLPEHTTRLATYRTAGGYRLLQACQRGEVTRQALLDTLAAAGLRGLGGAGFAVARKWQLVAEQPAPRLLAVNIDEGEPGTFKDRVCLEQDPHRLLEGALIAAWAVDCEAVYLYLRDEYAGLRQLLEEELAVLQASPPCPLPRIELRRGAGAYICGEESAMLESLEGKRGMPRQRPPYVAERGLFGRPTLVHNAETLFWIRQLAEGGAAGFAGQGRRGRHGQRRFSVSGRIRRPGVYLAPAGISVRELIEEYCDGMLPGHELYGYFPGGASGGILPAALADLPLDFDTLAPHGCFIGSAAVIVFSQQDRARDLALNAMRFFARESCGQCTPCRVGTVRAAELMDAPVWDQPLLERLGQTLCDASICGLGQAAPNPMRSVMRYFPQEVE